VDLEETPAPVVTLRRVVSIDTRYVTATRWMHIFILARLVVVVSRVSSSSRRLGWVRETDRIASRTARPDDDGGDLRIHTSRDAARAVRSRRRRCRAEEIYRD